MSELLKKFHEIADHPEKMMKAYLEKGYKVAGCAAPYTPEELVHSMGFVPMGLWGADIELKEAKKYFPTFICSIMQSLLELGVNGTYEGMSFAMIPSLCDSMQVTAENWKFAVPTIPVIFADYPHNRLTNTGFEYIVSTHKRQIAQIEKLTGATYSKEALEKTLDVYRKHAEVMRQFAKLSAECGMLPSDRNAVFKSAWFMLKEEHTELVEALITELKPVENTKTRIMTTGILADSKEILNILDSLDMTVVCDDVAHESRQYYVEYPVCDDPLETLAGKFYSMKHCSLIYDPKKTRISKVIEEAKRYKAEGIVYIQTKFCDPEEFDYVFLKRACEAENIPMTMIEVDRQVRNYGQAETALQAFKEIL